MTPSLPHKDNSFAQTNRANALSAMRFSVSFINNVLKDLQAVKLSTSSERAPAAAYFLYGQQVKKRLIEAALALKLEGGANA
jgi:hypothetical protein